MATVMDVQEDIDEMMLDGNDSIMNDKTNNANS